MSRQPEMSQGDSRIWARSVWLLAGERASSPALTSLELTRVPWHAVRVEAG